jgi:hypothetical protein
MKRNNRMRLSPEINAKQVNIIREEAKKEK